MRIYLNKGIKALIIASLVLVALALLLNIFDFILREEALFSRSGSYKGDQYLSVISKIDGIIEANPRVIDIALLGSHDSFSNEITKNSKVDPAESGMLANPALRSLIGAYIARFSKTQTEDAAGQLKAGVRYFDIRLSYVETERGGEWWTKHGSLSAPFNIYLKQILEFLNRRTGEFVILDFQHVYTADKKISDLFEYLATVDVNGKTIYDYIYYKAYGNDSIPLGKLRYNVVTDFGAESGAVMFVDLNELETSYEKEKSDYKEFFYNRYDTVRSLWHESASSRYLTKQIDKEAENILASSAFDNMLRINQTQHAFTLKRAGDLSGIIFGWSLLRLAEKHNLKLVERAEFIEHLRAMPVFMVDFATSAYGDFIVKVNTKIMEYNNNLCKGYGQKGY